MSVPWWWRRVAIALVLVGGLAVAITATVTRWEYPLWAPLLGGIVLVGVIAALSAPRRRSAPGRGAGGLYASDAYSDAELGRLPPTHPHRDPGESSQVGGLPPRDPLRLEPPDRHRPRATGGDHAA